jgi:hypothetical protein
MLNSGYKEDFFHQQKLIQTRIAKNWSTCQTHVCVGVDILINANPSKVKTALIWDVLGSTLIIPEYQTIFNVLSRIETTWDTHWNYAAAFLGAEPQKTFINSFILNAYNQLKWPQYVEHALNNIRNEKT